MRSDRYPEPAPDTLSDAERAVYSAITERRGKVPAPFIPLLKSPEIADKFEQLSSLLWKALPPSVLEMVFLMTAYRLRCHDQWCTHVAKARVAGLTPDDITVISHGKPLSGGLLGDVSQFVHELLEHHAVSDALHEKVSTHLSARGTVELVMFCGLANTIALLLNLRQPPRPSADADPVWCWKQAEDPPMSATPDRKS